MSEQSKRPRDNAFQQQRLRAWQPLLTPGWVIFTFVMTGIVFLPIGAAILGASANVTEIEVRYDHLVALNDEITMTLEIPEKMEPPIYFYYKLTNFYQNHRRYVKSRSDKQLRGEEEYEESKCEPLETDDDGDILYPCGLVANSFFNDTFAATLARNGTETILSGEDWSNKGIAWQTDIDDKFNQRELRDGETSISADGRPLPQVDDEEFIVWMRTAGLPTFKKLHRIIKDTTLMEGDVLHLNVANNFPTETFDGEKYVVLSTTSWLGGKNLFLGYAYIAVGIVSLFLALVFFIKHKYSPRPLGDMKYFSWPIKATTNPVVIG